MRLSPIPRTALPGPAGLPTERAATPQAWPPGQLDMPRLQTNLPCLRFRRLAPGRPLVSTYPSSAPGGRPVPEWLAGYVHSARSARQRLRRTAIHSSPETGAVMTPTQAVEVTEALTAAAENR